MKKQDDIQELGFEVEKEEIYFTLNGKRKVKMPLNEFRGLIDRDYIRSLVQKADSPEEDFEGLGLREFVLTSRLMKKGLGLCEAAVFLGTSEPRLRHFFNYARNKYTSQSNEFQEEMRRQSEDGHDYVKEKKKRVNPLLATGGPTCAFVDAARVKGYMKQGLEIFEIADRFNLDGKDFAEWFKINSPLLDLLQ